MGQWIHRTDVWVALGLVYVPATWILFRNIPLQGWLRWTYSLLAVPVFFFVMLLTVAGLEAVVPALIEWVKNPTILRRIGLPGIEAFIAFLITSPVALCVCWLWYRAFSSLQAPSRT